MAQKSSDLKPGDVVHGIFQNLKLRFRVSKDQPTGPDLWLEHDNGQVHVRKQDIRDDQFELEVKRRP